MNRALELFFYTLPMIVLFCVLGWDAGFGPALRAFWPALAFIALTVVSIAAAGYFAGRSRKP